MFSHPYRRPFAAAGLVALSLVVALQGVACSDDSSGEGGSSNSVTSTGTGGSPSSVSSGSGGSGATGGGEATGGGGSGGGGGFGGGPVLVPGEGFDDETPQPPPVGSGPGADKTAIAHWDVVPYVTFDGSFNVGVLAYHVNDIDRVEFSLEGGPWLSVSTPTLDPQTGAEEYWVTLDASSVDDGPIEIRAVAHPTVGIARVLQGSPSSYRSSLFLNANAQGTLSPEVRYVRADGDDIDDCTTPETACATLARTLEAASIFGRLDGAEIRLGAGDWSLPETNDTFFTEWQWLTITSAEDASREDVRITGVDGPSDGIGLHVKLLRLAEVSVIGPAGKASPAFEDYLWLDQSNMFSTNPNAIEEADCFSFGGDVYTGNYITDVHMDNMCNGPTNVTLARNVYAEKTAAGHASGTATVVNYTVEFIYGSTYMPGWPDYHGDVYQMYQRSEDIIIYGAKNVPGGFISSRGIVGSASPVSDVALVNVDLDFGGWVFSYCADVGGTLGPIDHMVIKDSRFVGASNWCGEAPGPPVVDPAAILNVLIQDSVFDNGSEEQVPQPWDLPGIRYVPAIE